MTTTIKALFAPKAAETVNTLQYTATNCTCQVTQFTATNTGTSNAAITVFVVPDGSSPSAANTIVSAQGVAPGEAATLGAMIAQVVEASGSIWTVASGSVTISASGAEMT